MNVGGLDINFDGSGVNDRPFVGNKSAAMNTVGIDGFWVTDANNNPGTPGTYYDLAANNQTSALNVVDPNKVRWLIPVLAGYSPQEVGRNSFLNAGTLYNDVALEKAVPTGLLHFERGQFVLRAEVQNVANHNNVGPDPLLNINLLFVGTPTFMNVPQVRESNNRALRFWAKYTF